ncbi:hypothetical protein J5N97_009423 [Dioscorea zingiberensis]|uniref:Uncharacterized protein n=1 Tax=Dioscorea zingiberensis TaxID=325984 RepID=A0A9D5HLT4_9LILI|nr:hypothetical protein J5N97_009423 [Dioscorea zingiberensis]
MMPRRSFQLQTSAFLLSNKAGKRNPLAAIRDLRFRIPLAHIALRLPRLHADSVASSNLFALLLNAHSTSRVQIPGRLAAVVTSIHYPVKRFSRFKVKGGVLPGIKVSSFRCTMSIATDHHQKLILRIMDEGTFTTDNFVG